MTERTYRKPRIRLTGEDGNAFAILGRVRRLLMAAEEHGGVPRGTTGKYLAEARSGDYDHLLQVTMEYVEVE